MKEFFVRNTLGVLALQAAVIGGGLYLGVPSVFIYTLVVLIVVILSFAVAHSRTPETRPALFLFGTGGLFTIVAEGLTATTNEAVRSFGGIVGVVGYAMIGFSAFMVGRRAVDPRNRATGAARVAALLDSGVVTIALVTVVLSTRLIPYFADTTDISAHHVTDALFFLSALLVAFPMLYLTFITPAFTTVNILFLAQVLAIMIGTVTGSGAGSPGMGPLNAQHICLIAYWVLASAVLTYSASTPVEPTPAAGSQSLSPTRTLVLFSGMITVPLLMFTTTASQGMNALYAVSLIASSLVVMARIMIAVNAMTQRHTDLKRQVDIDPLTGLMSRKAFLAQAEAMATEALAAGHTVSMVFIDLSDFKAVNDTYGHAAGDALLAQVGARLRHTMRESDAACRFGGDEFALIAADDHDGIGGQRLAERVFGLFSSAFEINGALTYIRASIGLSSSKVVDCSTHPVSNLLRAADEAMYDSKRGGSREFVTYKPRALTASAAVVGGGSTLMETAHRHGRTLR